MKPEKPPSLAELAKIHHDNWKKISECFSRQDAVKLIEKINGEVLYWTDAKRQEIPKDLTPEIIWSAAKMMRAVTARNLTIGKDAQFRFKFYLPDGLNKILHEIDVDAGRKFEAFFGGMAEQNNKILLESLMEESIASSQIEGAATTRPVAKEMLRTGRAPKNKPERMILNNYLAIQTIKDDFKSKPLSPEMLLELQAILTKDTLENVADEGRFRKSDDEVVVGDQLTGETIYEPPQAEKIPLLLTAICDYANDESGPYTHPVVKACILHFLIAYTHPFVDGNGRTARGVFYWYLLREGYWLFQYVAISRTIKHARAEYDRAYVYVEQDENDITYFLKFNLEKISLAMRDFYSYLERKRQEQKAIFSFRKIPGINERQAIILNDFARSPERITTISEVQKTFNVVYQTARNDLLELEKLGFLHQKKSGLKYIFYKSEKFNALLEDVAKNA
ncbi:MAG: Fic family protein [Candidatus Micrarchaeia archaeon]